MQCTECKSWLDATNDFTATQRKKSATTRRCATCINGPTTFCFGCQSNVPQSYFSRKQLTTKGSTKRCKFCIAKSQQQQQQQAAPPAPPTAPAGTSEHQAAPTNTPVGTPEQQVDMLRQIVTTKMVNNGVSAMKNGKMQGQPHVTFEFNSHVGTTEVFRAFERRAKRSHYASVTQLLKHAIANPSLMKLGYHSTTLENAKTIMNNGFDPTLRKKQRFGDGEYFAEDIHAAIRYARHDGMTIGALIFGDKTTVKKSTDGVIYVVNNPVTNVAVRGTYCLPLFVIGGRHNATSVIASIPHTTAPTPPIMTPPTTTTATPKKLPLRIQFKDGLWTYMDDATVAQIAKEIAYGSDEAWYSHRSQYYRLYMFMTQTNTSTNKKRDVKPLNENLSSFAVKNSKGKWEVMDGIVALEIRKAFEGSKLSTTYSFGKRSYHLDMRMKQVNLLTRVERDVCFKLM